MRSRQRAGSLERLGVALVQGDLDDVGALDALLTGGEDGGGVDGLFHVAGWYQIGSPTPELGHQVNVVGTRNVLTAALRAGTRKVVHTSTLAVNSDTGGAVRDETYRHHGEHLSVYDRTKAQAHHIADELVAQGLPLVIVMPGGIYGPGDTSQVGGYVAQVASGRRPLVPRHGGTLMWAHVEDVAAGHLLAMERGRVGESYMLAGEPATLAELLGTVADLAGTKGPVLVPETVLRLVGRVLGPLEGRVPLSGQYHPETMRAALASYVGTAEKARGELGWRSRDLRDGLRQTITATDVLP
ncbi:NAD-dependent epimerase/dehydratase family protein [Ornithinimicrobium tianjinense]